MTKPKIVLAIFLSTIFYSSNAWRIENNVLIIEKGDNLSKISHALFGQGTQYDLLWKRSLDSLLSKNPNLIFDGMRFNLDSIFTVFKKTESGSIPVINNFPLVFEKQSDNTLDASAWAAILSAIFAFAAIIATILLNSKSVRNAARIEHNNFFQEIDKRLIEDPLLWTVYNTPQLAGGLLRPITPLHKMKRKAFLYLHLNSYDSIFYFYDKLVWKGRVDKSTFESWSEYYKNLYNNSDEFQEIVKAAIEKKYYQKDFINHLKKEFRVT
jgi:hypothetical protein